MAGKQGNTGGNQNSQGNQKSHNADKDRSERKGSSLNPGGDVSQKKGDSGNRQRVSKGNKEAQDQGKKDDKKKKGTAEKLRNAAVANAAGTVASHAAKLALLLKLKQMLMMFVQQVAQAVASVGAVVATLIASVVLFGIVGTVAIIASIVINNDVARKDTNFVDCTAYIDRAMIGKGGNETTVDITKLQRQTAKRIYSAYSHYGLRPEQVFAVLGNWKHESGLDPTSVETVIGTEDFRIGLHKQQAISVDFELAKWNKPYADQYPNIERNGIGLGQWTNGRNKKLVEYAKLYGMQNFKGDGTLESMWYDLNVQLAFSIDTADVGDDNASWFDSWKDIGAEKWDGDIKVDVDFNSKNKWDTTTTTNGRFDDETLSLHPVGEDNDENEIGRDNKDDYYHDDDRNDAKLKASQEMDAMWPSILASHPPAPYTDEHGVYHDGIDEANNAAKKEYIKKWKKKYRFYLYKFTVERYTKQFAAEWEVCNDGSEQTRVDYALEYFYEWWDEANKIESQGEPNFFVGADNPTDSNDYFFFIEEGYGEGILSVMGKTKDRFRSSVNIYTYDHKMTECSRITYEQRKSIAKCAVMLAWPTISQSCDNDGTELYKYVHDQVIQGDSNYQSCDRTVCTAVRWSGYDDDYPKGATLNQIQYLVTSPRWIELDWGGDRTQLQPGDVLIRKDTMETGATTEPDNAEHHTLIYTGEVITRNYYDRTLGTIEEGSCIVHGSFNERSPGIGKWNDKYSTYHAFRCIYPLGTNASKYKKISIPPNL